MQRESVCARISFRGGEIETVHALCSSADLRRSCNFIFRRYFPSVTELCLSDALTSDYFTPEYLQPGRKYSLLFGGAYFGEGYVGEENRNATIASLIYTGSLKIRGQVRARATNAEPGDFRVASREPAMAEQLASALALAREIFSQHGTPESLLTKVRAEYVTRTHLAPSPHPA
ncbi:MAG TPA: hypothetical protein VIX91_08785 [Candidatus Acidoferrum sp.]